MDIKAEETVKKLKEGQVGVIPTDTIYGLVASALLKHAVERVYALKGRDFTKPCIILLPDTKAIGQFTIKSDKIALATSYWPGPFSIILPLQLEGLTKWQYLHRGKNSLAFRCPDNPYLQKLLKKTGPLIAPSANPEGKQPARDIAAAKTYFGNTVDFYVDGGALDNNPSTIISLINDKPEYLR